MNITEIQLRDPFVVLEGDTYYLFGTTDADPWNAPGGGFDAYTSEDLVEFAGPYPVFRPADGFWGLRNFWAPEVHYYRDAYYMFASFLPNPDAGIGTRRGTAVLKSERGILGPYEPWSLNSNGESAPVTPCNWDCLDGTLFVEEGLPYLVFCHEWVQCGEGTVCASPLNRDLRQANGEPRVLFRASETEWVGPPKGRAPGCLVTDGPFLYKPAEGGLLMFWSSFDKKGKYCVGLASSNNGCLSGHWDQCPLPLYADNGGHAMVFTDKNGELRLALHKPNKTPNERALFLDLNKLLSKLYSHLWKKGE